MTKAIIIYGSTTGNTEELSEYVADGLKSKGAEVRIENVIDIEVRIFQYIKKTEKFLYK